MTPGPAAGRPADILTTYILGPLRDAGFDLEDVAVRRAGRQSVVAVTVDRDGPVDLDAIADASRIVSGVLDERDVDLPAALGSAYTLEVTSRGADAPLRLPRHWRRAVGRLVGVKLRDGSSLSGRVFAADDEQATVRVTPKPHKPGARSGVATDAVVRYADVARAAVELEFNPPGGTDEFDELDATGNFDDLEDVFEEGEDFDEDDLDEPVDGGNGR